LVREALTNVAGLGRSAVACCAIVAALSLTPLAAHVMHRHFPPHHPEWPLQISGSQYAPAAWTDIPGWSADDHLAAYRTFRASCRPIVAQQSPAVDSRALGWSLRDPCEAARADDIRDGVKAEAFFERHFLPLQISRLGEDQGFVTGYYEPVIDGSRTQTDVYTVPVYRRPSNLFVRGKKQSDSGLPNKG
jgi:membrane-bound lytic murein transglycosylase A